MNARKQKKKLGEVLLEFGYIDHYQLESGLQYQQKWGGKLKLGAALVHLGFISEGKLVNALHRYYDIPVVKLNSLNIPKDVLDLVPESVAKKYLVLPVGKKYEGSRKTLGLSMSDPTDLVAINEIEFTTGHKVKVYLASITDIQRAIERNYHGVELTPIESESNGSGNFNDDDFLVDESDSNSNLYNTTNAFDKFLKGSNLGANLNDEALLELGKSDLVVGNNESTTQEIDDAKVSSDMVNVMDEIKALSLRVDALGATIEEQKDFVKQSMKMMKIYNGLLRALLRKGVIRKSDLENEIH